ncbi:hypothetical protein SSS_06072 [Sarcoptes scabiei]|nr:hypothetical protein SSS_06072 [Sarcoptes scabiei]
MSDSRFQEKLICRLDEISLNQTKVVLVNDVKICVYRQSSDEILAFGNECSHFGAPLNSGLIHNDYVVCPWHAACFSIRTGDIEEFPGCDNIPVFKTIIKDGKVYVLLSEDNLRKTMTKSLFRRNISKKDVFLIIGGGPASFQCAETLRQEGFIGRIVMVTNEDVSPYDRTKLTKLSTIKIENIVLRNEDYYKRAQIETLYKTTCFKIDFESKIAYFDDCSNLYYDKLFLGTGSRPRKYDEILDGLENVFYIRTYKNSNDVVLLAKDKNIVLIGSSFIVVEMAGVLLKIAKSVKIISRSEVPFAKSLGKQFGTAIKKFLISKNIEFIFITEKLDFTIENRNLTKIKSNNLDFPVDLCVIGIGSLPNSEFLKDTEIKLKNSFVEVDENFQTSVNDVYAGGDLVVFPNKELFGDQLKNIAHWQVAQSHEQQLFI